MQEVFMTLGQVEYIATTPGVGKARIKRASACLMHISRPHDSETEWRGSNDGPSKNQENLMSSMCWRIFGEEVPERSGGYDTYRRRAT